jgi:ribosomal protein S7
MEEKGLASFQNLTTYFLKKGKLSKIETHVRSYLKSNLKKKKSKLLDQAQKSINKVIPYVRLLVRKRGKRFKYRVEYLEKKRGKRKAYLSIAKELSENKTSYFLNVLQKEIETVASKKSNLLVKKNTLHETAKFAIPYK